MIDRSLENLQPHFRAKAERLLAAHPEVFLTETLRTTERQQQLYSQGRITPGSIVTWLDGVNKISEHQKGLAIDIAFYGHNQAEMWPEDHMKWENVAKTARSLGMLWGYDLWRTDRPHFHDDPDVSLGLDWSTDAIAWATNAGISNGERLDDNATRREVLVMLHRANEL